MLSRGPPPVRGLCGAVSGDLVVVMARMARKGTGTGQVQLLPLLLWPLLQVQLLLLLSLLPPPLMVMTRPQAVMQ